VREVPTVNYLRHPAGTSAYQVWGQGELELLLIKNVTTSVDNIWEHPGRLRFLSSDGELGRVIRFDPRGQGASDPLPLEEVGQLDPWLDDARPVGAPSGTAIAEQFSVGQSLSGLSWTLRNPVSISSNQPGSSVGSRAALSSGSRKMPILSIFGKPATEWLLPFQCVRERVGDRF